MAKEFVKFELKETDDEYDLFFERLVENVTRHYKENIKEFLCTMNRSLEGCESPIEQILSMAIEMFDFNKLTICNPKIDVLGYFKNEFIKTTTATYRVDFLFDIVFILKNKFVGYLLVVECDGFQYHQGNKDQIDKDYKRQNDLLANGYDVMRFTGSAINKNPNECVREIIKHILKKLELAEKENEYGK